MDTKFDDLNRHTRCLQISGWEAAQVISCATTYRNFVAVECIRL